jgi:hypothetical protein
MLMIVHTFNNRVKPLARLLAGLLVTNLTRDISSIASVPPGIPDGVIIPWDATYDMRLEEHRHRHACPDEVTGVAIRGLLHCCRQQETNTSK